MKQAEPTDAPSDAYLRLKWTTNDRFLIEKAMVVAGGYKTVGGQRYGNGRLYHFRAAMAALLPHFKWQPWSELVVKCFVENSEIGIVGPASSGKTYTIAACVYTYIQCFPSNTSILVSTTDVRSLQLRIWGSIKEIHNKAKKIRPNLQGKIMESKHSLSFQDEADEAIDLRDAIVGIPCKVGGTWVGISSYVGLKNERIILVADEAHLMESGFIDSLANMRKSSAIEFKMIALGNPKDTTDPLGVVCEPHPDDGGWEAYSEEPITRTWRTRADNGIAVQLCGYDTPNGDAKRGEEPYKGIIVRQDIENDARFYGKESIHFTMMNLGIFPRNCIEKRVVTMSLCESNGAFEEAVWDSNEEIHRVIGIDAAYSGVGGDRCVMTDLTWGRTREGTMVMAYTKPPIIIPVNMKLRLQPEDQIANFVMEYCIRNGIPASSVGLDSTGKGTLVGALGRLWSVDVTPIEFGGPPTDRVVQDKDQKTAREAFGKFVTELWFASRAVIVGKQMRNMPRDVAKEGATRGWDYTKGMKQDVEPKDETKQRLGRSPDLWDSLVVAIEMARRNGFEIATLAPVGIKKRTASPWMTKMLKAAKAARHELIEA